MAKSFVGTVQSDKADKTIVVAIEDRKTHPIYKKQYTMTKRFIAHDAKNEAAIGDTVRISETRPISKRKHFILTEVISQAPITHQESTDETIEELV